MKEFTLNNMKLPNKYIAIDIETSDSEGDIGDVIQIGAVIINEDLSAGPEWSIYLKPTSPHRNPKAMEVNKISEETLAEAMTADQCLDIFESWCKQHAGKRPLLAAWGTYFDVSFMRQFYKKIGRHWPFSYRCLDLKTIAIWEVSKRGGDTAAGGVDTFLNLLGLEFEGTAHDALDDIKNTVRIIQNL